MNMSSIDVNSCGIEFSKDNKKVINLKINNKSIYLGSKYAVSRDIENTIKQLGTIGENNIIIIFGLGAGEHILELMKIIKSNSKILVIEPCLEIIDIFSKTDNAAFILADTNVNIISYNTNIKAILNSVTKKYLWGNIKVASYANYPKLFEFEYNDINKHIRSIIFNKSTQRDTLAFFSKILFKNFMMNIKMSEKFISINKFRGLFRNKPAVVVSAGPSLEKNIHLLKEVQDKIIIICGARTLIPLEKNGIKPDFVCAVDPQEVTFTIMQERLEEDVPLVFMESVNYRLVEKYQGPKVLFSNQGMEPYLKEITGVEVDSLLQGGSVAHVCMGLAVYMGCSTIIFVGQDLAYTNDKFHADIAKAMKNPGDIAVTALEANKEQWLKNPNENIYVDDIYGNKVRTSTILNSYREEFEDLIGLCPQIQFINSTEGGANINGTSVMDLKASINKYGMESISKTLDNIVNEENLLNKADIDIRLVKIKSILKNIINTCSGGVKLADQMYYYYAAAKKVNINKVFEQVDKVDIVIGDMQKIGILAYLLSPYMEEVLNGEEFKEKPKESERESGIRIAKRCKALYESIIQAAEEAVIYL